MVNTRDKNVAGNDYPVERKIPSQTGRNETDDQNRAMGQYRGTLAEQEPSNCPQGEDPSRVSHLCLRGE
ncbi:MAG: hypothetical protein ACLU4J_04565 [Butyricimonas paravirosa]